MRSCGSTAIDDTSPRTQLLGIVGHFSSTWNAGARRAVPCCATAVATIQAEHGRAIAAASTERRRRVMAGRLSSDDRPLRCRGRKTSVAGLLWVVLFQLMRATK